MEIEKKEEVEQTSIFKTLIIFLMVGALVCLLFSCSSVPAASITEKRDTVVKYVTDRSFSIKDSFNIKFDSLGAKEFGFLNAPIERIAGREIVHDTIKFRYYFKQNRLETDYKSRPDTVYQERVKWEKSETVTLARPWGEIVVYILVGFAICALSVAAFYGWKKWL